ncbi:MAG TPA: HlyD family efflux transporter periplasmic adaptor subunit [Fimbriiglobus sp.]|jgi:WD40 repeat protein
MRRIRRWLFLAALTGSLGLYIGCNPGSSTSVSTNGETTAANIDIGSPLYAKVPMPALPANQLRREPIVIANAVVSYAEKQTVPAQVDAYVLMLASKLPPGTAYNPNDERIMIHPREVDKKNPTRVFRRLVEGDRVKKGEVVAWLDQEAVEVQYRASALMESNADEQVAAAKKSLVQIQDLLNSLEEAKKNGAAALSEVVQLQINQNRFMTDEVQARGAKIKATSDKDTAETLLRKHQPQSTVTGIIKKVFKNVGEFVKAGDPIMEIQQTDTVMVEGNLPAQYGPYLKRGMKVRIEPDLPVSEDRNLGTAQHRAEVTGVAVTGQKDRPLVVSAGLDNNALVWDVCGTKNTFALHHPTGVKAVACTGPDVKTQFAVTGGEDGQLRFWDLHDPDHMPKEPSKTTEDGHAGPVSAVAFSPDGRYVASASGREVVVWDAATAKRLYVLPTEHKDTVTTLRFTPQSTLVTVCRDKSVRVWNLGTQGASMLLPIDHRAGVADCLGVSSDGSRMLFDQTDDRIDVVSLADGRTVGTLQTTGAGRTTGTGRFATLAIFSWDDSLVLTGCGEGSRSELQLWETPKIGGRGQEQRRCVTPTESEVTCAAFSPDKDHPFVVVGTKAGGVHVWTPPGKTELAKIRTGTIESVLPFDDKTVQVRVRAINTGDETGDGMPDRSRAKIIVSADQVAPTEAVGSAVVPNAHPGPNAVVPVGGLVIPQVPNK